MPSKINYEEKVLEIEELCKTNGYIPSTRDLMESKVLSDFRRLNKYVQSKGYDNWQDYFRNLGYTSSIEKKDDLKVGNKYVRTIKLTLEDLKILYREFKDKYKKLPTSIDCNSRQYNLPTWDMVSKILKENNSTLNDFYISLGKTDIYSEEYLIELLKKYIDKYGIPHSKRSSFGTKYGIPAYKTYASYFGDDLAHIIELTGFQLTEEEKYKIQTRCRKSEKSKDEIIKIVLDMQRKINKPLMYDDFRNPTKDTIGITEIKKYFGSMNKMKEELGLEIIQENMYDKVKSKDEMLSDMQNFINELGRIPTSDEIDSNKNILNACTYYNYFGGINNVFLQLGYTPNKKLISLHMTDDEIKEIYKDFIEECGHTPAFDYCKDIYKLPAPITVLRRFNCTWNEFIIMLGFEPNDAFNRGVICYADDGTQCLSFQEYIIHNYLLKKNITIEKEYFYRDLTEENKLKEKCGYKRLDWKIQYNNQQYYIENFGLYGNATYDKRHDYKLQLVKDLNIESNFIAIYPKDISKLDEVFSFLQ